MSLLSSYSLLHFTCVELNLELIMSSMSVRGKCLKCRVFNVADGDTERRRTLILRKIVRQWNEEKADNAVADVASSLNIIIYLFNAGGKVTKNLNANLTMKATAQATAKLAVHWSAD